MMKIISMIPVYVCVMLAVAGNYVMSQEVKANHSGIVPEVVVAQWGYRTITTSVGKQYDWQIERFGAATVQKQRLKAIAEVPGWPHTFYRFTITEEQYSSPQAATNRIKGLLDIPPSVETKMDTDLVLCKGFVYGKSALIVSTDVLKFKQEELPRIYALLEQFIKNR